MSVSSLEFLFFLLCLSGVFFLIPGATARRGLLFICNLVFVHLCLPNALTWVMLAVFSLSGFAVARILLVRPRGWVLGTYLAALVYAFIALKRYEFLGFMIPHALFAHPFGTIGLSYLLFRQIHFLVDVAQEQIPQFTLFSYVNYQFNLFGFLSGPIQRYQEFHDRWNSMQPLVPDRHAVLSAYLRVFLGVIKVSLISAVFLAKFDYWEDLIMRASHGHAAVSKMVALRGLVFIFYSYPLYLYFNFSGYCDIVIAAAALVGIEMPENFDKPYLSRNMIDYWTRFHRSLGFWIRDYLFTPMYKAAATRWPTRASTLVYPCYFVAFVLAGVWHGSTLNFAIFGVLQGIGASVTKIWESILIARIGRKGLKKYNASTPIRIAAIVVTLHFAAFTYIFFPPNLGQTLTVFRYVFLPAHQVQP